jgi:hypothetical protein
MGVERLVVDAEAVVQHGEVPVGLVEVEGEAGVHVHRAERPDAGLRRLHAEDLGKQLRRREAVAGRDDEVVEVNCACGRPSSTVPSGLPPVNAGRPKRALCCAR